MYASVCVSRWCFDVLLCVFFYVYGDDRDLHLLTHSFPTRRSSDLRDVGARPKRQMMFRPDMRRFHQVDASRIDDDQLRALAQTPFHPACEDRMAIGGVCADDKDNGLLADAVEILRAG